MKSQGQGQTLGRWTRAAFAVTVPVTLALAPDPGLAQGPWTATLMVQPYPSAFVADWQRNPQTAVLTVLYTGAGAQDFRIEGYVASRDRGELARVVSPPLSFAFGPVSQIFTSADILDWATVSRNQQYLDLVLRTGVMPEGPLQMCARIISLQDVQLALVCTDFTIALPDPPQLIFPANGSVVAGAQPVFQWTPVRVPAEIGVTYRVRVVERLPEQTPQSALTSNPTWFETDIDASPLLVYPIDALPLEDQKEYVWRVEALDAGGSPLARGGRTSEIWTFRPGGPARPPSEIAGVLPDVIDLIPGVARLTGLASMAVEEGIASYVLNGNVRLEVTAPAAFEATVEARDVQIDKLSLQSVPRVTSGSLSGELSVSAIPGQLAGKFAQFDQIDYTPAAGLTLTAKLSLPGADPIPLVGTVRLTGAGLFGALYAEGTNGASLQAYGDDPARLLVQRADVQFPAGTVDLTGDVELFKKAVACPGVTAAFDAQGTLGAQVACTPREPVALVDAGDRFRLDLLTLTGGFTFNTTAKTLSYALHTAAQLKLDARPGGANCGANLALDLDNGAINLGEFAPRCDATEGSASLGWLSTKLSTLTLKRFAYTPANGFDFELSVDLIPWLPDLPGLKLPSILAVSVTRDGLSLPAVDMAMTEPMFILAGFGVQVKRLRLPAFTLSWANWQIQSASDFVFAFDADLSLPKISGEAACLTAQPVSITGAELSRGRFKMHLAERQFSPACGITLRSEAERNLADIGLTETTVDEATSQAKVAGATTRAAVYAAIGETVAAGGSAGGTVTGPCGLEIPAAWDEPAKPGTERKCGSGPWHKIEEPATSTLSEPSSQPTKSIAELNAAVAQTRQDAEAAQSALDAAYDNPACVAPTDPTVTKQCEDDLAKARKDADDSRSALITAWQERYFGDVRTKWMRCIEAQRNEAGEEAVAAACSHLPDRDSLSREVQKLLEPPYQSVGPALRRWCGTVAPAAGMVVLEVERSLAFMPGGNASQGIPQVVTDVLDLCMSQALNDLSRACTNGGTPARRQHEAVQALGYARQKAVLGFDADAEAAMYAVQSCPMVAQAGSSASGRTSLLPRPPSSTPADVQPVAPSSSGGPFLADDGERAEDAPRAAAPAANGASFDVRLELERFGGDFDISFYPFFVVNKIPEIAGNIVLPSIFDCTDASNQRPPITAKLRLGPRGEINASVLGFIPACPLQLAAVEVTVTRSELTFSTQEGSQSLVLAGGVSAKFTAGASSVTGNGSLAIDLLHGRFIDGSIAFQGPFELGLPREQPVVAFSLGYAVLDTLGIHVDGRAELVLGEGQTIGTTFDHVTINPVAVAITEGRILFDASFGLEVGIGADGELAWGATPNGAELSVQTGLRIDLPSQVALSSTGFSISGDGGARILYQGRDVANLVTKFSPGFALSLNPPGVASGMVDFQLNGVSIATIDRLGFHPNLAYLASAVLPDKLPLPSEAVAYLELRDAAGTLRVSTENSGNGIRIFTTGASVVPLMVPALQAGRPIAPRLDVTFDLTLDPLGTGVSLGRIAANVPAGNEDAFDLSPNGLPFAVQTIAYDRSPGGAYQWTLAGALKLFDHTQGGGSEGEDGDGAADRVVLTLDGSGRLTGAVNLTPNQVIPIVEGSDKVALTLQTISGSFDANLPAQQFRFDLSASAALDLTLSSQDSYHAGATLAISEQGVRVENLTLASAGGADDFKYLDLAAVQLGLNNLRIPELGYTRTGGFQFHMLFDAALRFPALRNLTLPPIRDIALSNSGFSIPAYEAPELHLATVAAAGDNATMTSDGPLDLGGFALDVKAFRMSRIDFNWFTGQGPTNWGFGFDLELGLGNLIADAPQAFKDMRAQILNAGLRNGRFYGTLERLAFPTPLNIGIGRLYAISGALPDPSTAGADVPFALTAELELSLGAVLPICQGETQISKPNSTLSLYGDGWFSGVIDGIVPTCPITDGPFQITFTQSRVAFGYGNPAGGARTRTLELAVGATATFPGITEGSTVTASGNVQFDILQGRWIDGRIDILDPFQYRPSDDNPYFAFNVDRASLDTGGLHFTGGGALRAKDGANIAVQFNNLTFSLPTFQVADGSVTFLSQFALGVGIAEGGMQWGVYSPTAPRPEGSSFRFVAPESITIDATGLAIAGTASAELAFNGQTFSTLQLAFLNGFKVGFNPVAVRSGRANFILSGDEIAHLDATGFWPGNLFGVLPVPARLGLPGEDVAYVELRNAANDLLIETQTSSTGLQLRTRLNQPVKLVVPALKGEAQAEAPWVNVSFDIVVNPATFQFVSGFVKAEGDVDAPALMSLEHLGVPLTLRRIAFERIGSTNVYGLRAAGRFKLPESLNNLKVDIPNIVITAQGLWGDVQMGAYLPEYTVPDAPTPPVLYSASFLGDTLKLDVTGARLHFGSGASFALKGNLTSLLFKEEDEPPTVLKWSGSVSEQTGVTLQLDDTQDGMKLPIAFALFEPQAIGNEPALRISADPQEFKVRLSGVLTVPSMSSDFAIAIAGFQIGTRGVVFPSISIQGADPTQELRLFGAKFRLKDSVTTGGNVVFPALKVGNDQGVMSVTLSGEVEFIDNLTRFWGLKIATKGPNWVSIAGANLFDRPLTVVENVLTVDKATIENNALRAQLSVTLPAPLNGSGAQQVFFGINANGQVTGGTNLALINQIPSLTHGGTGPDTHFAFGPVATVHVRYLGLTLDFANLRQNSSIQAVSDFYLQNTATNLIKLGDVTGNTVLPGLRIGFDGNVTWGNVALSRQFSFDFEAVKLKVTDVSWPAQTGGFAIGLTGKLGLNVAAVSGELDFEDFTIGAQGINFSPHGLRGGELSIASVVRLQLSDVAFSNTPATIEIKGGSMPSAPAAGQNLSTQQPTSGTQSVQVASYLSFGGTLSVVDVFSGGVERFLFYRGTDQTTHLIIQQANLRIPQVVTFFADFRYDQTATGFEMFMGADGTLLETWRVQLVGAFARESELTRAGIFLAVRGLQIQLGPFVTIKGLGGGFFVNPKPEWLQYVRNEANVSQTAGKYIAAPASGFAVLLYGEAGIIRPELITGRLLVTIADTYFRIDGGVVVLSQNDKFTGDFHVQIKFTETDIQGNIGLTIAYGAVLTGGGHLDIYIQSDTRWGVYGTASVSIIKMFNVSAEVIVGPAGFYLGSRLDVHFDIWIVKLEAFMEGDIWYTSQGFGAYLSLGATLSLFGGIAGAQGTLHGVLLFYEVPPSIFLAASLKLWIVGLTWEGWAWLKFQDGRPSAGLGQDPEMMAAIAEADRVRNELMASAQETKQTIEELAPLVPQSVALADQDLVAAYQSLQGWSNNGWLAAQVLLEFNEYAAAVRLNQTAREAEETYRGWYYGVLRREGIPGDTARVVQYAQDVVNQFNALQTTRPQVEARINGLGFSIQQLNPMSADAVTITNPLKSVTRPVFRDEVQPDGTRKRVLESGLGFDVDQADATEQTAKMKAGSDYVAASDLQIRQQIAALEAGLVTLRAATTTNDPAALPSFVGQYAAVASKAEQQFAAQADVILSRQDWMRGKLAELAGREASVAQWITAKTQSLMLYYNLYLGATPNDPNRSGWRSAMIADYVLLKDVTRYRVSALVALSGNQQLLTTFDDNVHEVEQQRLSDGTANWSARFTFIFNEANQRGRELFYEIARAGMANADAQATAGFAALGSQADERLGTIRQAHGGLSRSLDRLYEVQAEATGALYDLYDRYIFQRSGAETSVPVQSPTTGAIALLGGATGATAFAGPTPSATPSAEDLLNVSVAIARRDQLTQDLTVPRLNNVSVAASNGSRYSTQLLFSWSGWHPSGTYEFQFRDSDPTLRSRATGTPEYYSNGGTGSLTGYRFTRDRSAATTVTRNLEVGVRGGAGFTGYGRTSYTLNFLQGPSAPVTVSGGGLLADNTPPSTPVVSILGLAQRLNAAGQLETWTSNPDAIQADWSAMDAESGISEYEYTLVDAPNGSAIRPITSVGGRTSASFEQLTLPAGTPVYLAVRAKNGQGGVSNFGFSLALRYDATPPAFATGVAITPVVAGTKATSDQTYKACPVTPPAYPGATPTGLPLTFTVVSWDGALAGSASGGAPPRITFNVPQADDPESGIAGYGYRVTRELVREYTGSGWTPVTTTTQVVTVEGAPLDYTSDFYVAIAPRNVAGGVGAPLTYGPFRARDPTPPSRPDICAGIGGTGGFAVQLNADARDDETGVSGYQYRVRVEKQLLRDWPKGTTVDWTAGGNSTKYTGTLTLRDGQQYYVDVRAVNGQGTTSGAAISGPILYDASPPPAPSVVLALGQGLPDGRQELLLNVTAPDDPHSRLTTVQLTVGTSATASDVVAWTSQPVVAGASQIGVPIPAPLPGETRWVRVRTVNGAGLPSVIASASVTAPKLATLLPGSP